MLESNTDAAEWKLEVERVLPQLKVTIRTDNKVSFISLDIVWFGIITMHFQKIPLY